MRARFLAVAVGLTVCVSACASSRRSRPRPRPAPPPPARGEPQAETPKDVKPLWFGTAGTSDGRRPAAPPPPPTTAPAAAPPPTASGPRPNDESPLGTNLAPPSHESRDWVFVDVFKMASPWVSRSTRAWDDGRKLELDDRGWVQALLPGQVAATQVPSLGGGQYIVLYKGRGTLQVERARVISDEPGRLVYEADPYTSVILNVRATNPSNHIRDIRVVPPAFEGTYADQVFHPLFVQRLRKFSVLRFTGWGRTEAAATPTWSRRTQPKFYTQAAPSGVAYEYMADLANAVGADAWVSVPHRANDELVREMARLFRDRLAPGLRVYVEFSHEPWRQDGLPSAYAQQQGQFMGLGGDPRAAQLAFIAKRSTEIFQIFGEILGRDRVTRVISGPLDEPDALATLLDAVREVDVLAVAPELGADVARSSAAADMDVDALLDTLEFTSLPKTLGRVRAAQKITQPRSVGLITYSGGQDFDLPDTKRGQQVRRTFAAASRSPRMRALYLAMLEGWQKNGGELFVHAPLVSPPGSNGGALAYQDQAVSEAPKYAALLSFADNNPRWWGARRGAPPAAPVAEAPATAGPADAGLTTEAPPADRSAAIWSTGGAGVVAAAAGAIFTGLYLSNVAQRDRILADDFAPLDGTEARDLDNGAYNTSIGATASFGLAAIGFGASAILGLLDESEPGGTNTGLVLSASTGAVALGASIAYFAAYLNTLGVRDDRIENDPNPSNSLPLRTLDDEAFRWSLASGAALGVAAASFATSLVFYLTEQRDPYAQEYDPYGDGYDQPSSSYEPGDVEMTVLPGGLHVSW